MVGFINPIIIPFIKQNVYQYICQIGVSEGKDTDKLLRVQNVHLTLIDPCLDEDLVSKYRNYPNVEVCKGLSLEILPTMKKSYDCILIDGDHNWFTVFNELIAIEAMNLLRNGGAIFLHDVSRPYGRRDMYYLPDTIPPSYVHPYAKDSGYATALHENGPKNGVLTAVEDFVNQQNEMYMFLKFDVFHGLGLLVKQHAKKTRIIFLQWLIMSMFINQITKLIRS